MQFDFDVIAFLQTGGTLAMPTVFLTFALAWVYGQFGVTGKAQLAACLGTGFVLGGGLMIAANGVPASFAEWFALVIYAAVMGVAEPLGYEHGKALLEKILARALVK